MVVIRNKIQDLKDLAMIIEQEHVKGRKVVHCHGVFDLLHIGHIRYFEQARQMGDVLIVTLTPDRYVDKGPDRPAFSENLRAEAIASLNFVDYVAINQWPTAEETLRLLRPDIYVKGSEFRDISSDMTGKIGREEKIVREIGAKLAFTEDIVFSSTNLINRFFSSLPNELQEYLHIFRNRYSLNDIFEILDRMQNLKVLVVGDSILDDYHFCEVIGTSSKDPSLAIKYKSNDLFAGGALAISNHVANFVNNVELLTILGEIESHEDFIRSQLQPNILPQFIFQDGAPTTIKRRFVEGYSLNKLLEVYIIDDSGLSPRANAEACRFLEEKLPMYDVVIAADFGHGAISKEMIRILADHSKFLAVNTQANAGNRGFNTISRYHRADYISMAEHEIRLEKRNSNGPLRPIIQEFIGKIGCKQFVVTRGRQGAIVADFKGNYVDMPSFANNIVDRVGAGDAFFAITSLASALNAPNEILGFIGNIAGALAVEIVGNKKAIDKVATKKYITSLMK
jgi:rfaE bifunctional protein nucleotidyltransferase chain/domain